MKIVTLFLISMFALPLFAKGSFKLIHVADLKQAMASKQAVYVFDANMKSVRQENGVIPGAKLLSSYNHYSLSVLPKNKDSRLVFYCANTHCTASHGAAEVALNAGYSNVQVMADGIQGWVKAGEKTVKPNL